MERIGGKWRGRYVGGTLKVVKGTEKDGGKQDRPREKAEGRQWDFIRIGVARGP